MKNAVKMLAISICIMLLAGLAACTGSSVQIPQASAAPQADAAPSQSAELAPAEPRTITDLLGREVTLPSDIRTIAAINGAARMLTYAGATEKLIGVTDMDKSNAAAMPYSVVNAEAFSKLASIGSGGSGDTVYVEELVELAPDVIFAFTNDAESVESVQSQTGIPVVGLYADRIFDQAFYDTLTMIGSIMGNEDHCANLIAEMKGWAEDLDNRTKGIAEEDKPSVYTGAVSFRGGHGFEGTCGKYPPFEAIRAKNVVDETGEAGALLIDLEKVTVWDPDIIFLNPSNLSMVNEDYAVNPSFYDNLTAVKNGKVFAQVAYNYNWCNMEIAMVDAYYAGTVIYPEQFADVDFNEKAEEIFRVMLGCEYLETLNKAGIGFAQITIGK